VWKLVGALVLVHRLVWFFSNVYRFSDPPVHSVAFNKSAVTDHVIFLNHVTDWDHAKVIDRESKRIDRWIREVIHIRKEQDKLMNQDEGSYQLPHIYDYLLSAAATPGGQSFERRQQRLPKRATITMNTKVVI